MALNGSSSRITARPAAAAARTACAGSARRTACRSAAVLEAGEADGGDRLLHRVAVLAADAAEQAFAAPQPDRHHVVDADREAAVDIRDLRQVGDVLRRDAVALDAPGERLMRPTTPLNSVDLPAPFGPTTAVRLRPAPRRRDDGRPDAGHSRHQVAELKCALIGASVSPHRPERRPPKAARSGPSREAEPLKRRHPQDRRMRGGRRMRVALVMVVVMAVMMMVEVAHGRCYNITLSPLSRTPKPFISFHWKKCGEEPANMTLPRGRRAAIVA